MGRVEPKIHSSGYCKIQPIESNKDVMLTIAEIILVVFFILLGGKWYLRGTYNETISQLVFIIPLILFVYIGIIHLLYNQERYPKE